MSSKLVLVFFLHLGAVVIANPYWHAKMKPCPSFESQSNFDINQIMGKWKLAVLLIDELEQYEDDSSCVQGNFEKINSTAFEQMWYINSSQYGYGVLLNLPTVITYSGDWTVTDPLGGNLQVKIGHASPESHLSMTYCGMQQGILVHLWTAVATRKTHITQIDFLQLYAELLSQGFNMNDSTLITWRECQAVITTTFPH